MAKPTAREVALKEISQEARLQEAIENQDRYFRRGGKNPTWDNYTVGSSHIIHRAEYFENVDNIHLK